MAGHGFMVATAIDNAGRRSVETLSSPDRLALGASSPGPPAARSLISLQLNERRESCCSVNPFSRQNFSFEIQIQPGPGATGITAAMRWCGGHWLMQNS